LLINVDEYVRSANDALLTNERLHTVCWLHCVSKNIPDIFSCNLSKHFLIWIFLAQMLLWD